MKRKIQKQYTITTATIVGLLISIVLVLIYISITTTLMLNGKISESVMRFMEPGILLLALYFGTIITLRNVTQAYLLVSGIIAVCYTAIAIATNIIMFDASFHAAWVEVFSALIGSGLACLTRLKTIGRTKHNHKYR